MRGRDIYTGVGYTDRRRGMYTGGGAYWLEAGHTGRRRGIPTGGGAHRLEAGPGSTQVPTTL